MLNGNINSVGKIADTSGDKINFDDGILVIDESNNRIGVGTASPSRRLEVNQGQEVVSAKFTGNNLSGHLIDIDHAKSGENSYNGFRFLDEGSNARGLSLTHIGASSPSRGKLQIGTADNGSGAILSVDGDNSRVGIGTLSPAKALHVISGTGINLTTALKLQKTVDGSGSATGILLGALATGQAKGGIFFENDGSGHGRGNLHFSINTGEDTNEAVLADAKMTIDSTGNVGINTASPSTTLTVNGTTSFQNQLTTLSSNAFTISKTLHAVQPESGTSDDLETINGGAVNGQILIIKCVGTNTITIKNKDGISGRNIRTQSGSDYVMNTSTDYFCCIFDSINWVELFKS